VKVGDSLAATEVEASVEVASLTTGNDQRDKHLRSPDFFDAARFPRMTFVSTQIWGTPANFGMKGNLTIRGITREVVFGARILDSGVVRAEAKVDRTAFGITYGFTIKNEVRLRLMIRLGTRAAKVTGA
jgi:polyisoprenoid-binding protein YceI